MGVHQLACVSQNSEEVKSVRRTSAAIRLDCGEVSKPTLYRLISSGELSVVKIGTRTIIRRSGLEAFLDRKSGVEA